MIWATKQRNSMAGRPMCSAYASAHAALTKPCTEAPWQSSMFGAHGDTTAGGGGSCPGHVLTVECVAGRSWSPNSTNIRDAINLLDRTQQLTEKVNKSENIFIILFWSSKFPSGLPCFVGAQIQYTPALLFSYHSVWNRGVCSSRTCAAFVARPRSANKGSSKSTLTSAPREENWRAGRLWWQNWFWLVGRRNSWELVATVLFLSFLQFGSILEPILISPNIWDLPFP